MFYPPPPEVFGNYRHRIYLLIILVVVESCSRRMEFLVLFRSPKSKTEHSTVRLGLAVARLARVPMGCEHPQGAVTRLQTST